MINENIIESAVGDIHVPEKGNNTTIDTSIEFTPENPFSIGIPSNEGEKQDVGYPGFPVEPEKIGVLKTTLNEFQEFSSDFHILHAANAPLTKPANAQVQYFYPDVNDKFYHPAPDGWSPKQEIEKLSDNVDPKFLPKLMTTKNPDDFNYTLESIHDEARRTSELQNGSAIGKILGGVLGLTLGSVENFIPLVSIATKAKVGVGFVSAALKNIPGILAASAIHEGAAQMDKIDGNLPDFLKDTFIDTAIGMTFFGVIGAAKPLINLSELGRLRQFARDSLDGIGFNFKVDNRGNLTGFEAVATGTGESLNAARITRAQEIADAAFYKGGLYKVPIFGTPIANILTGNLAPGIKKIPYVGQSLAQAYNYVLGSPVVQLKTATDYPEAGAFADAAFDHFITTEGEIKGIVRPKSFEYKVKQTRSMLTSLKIQTDALHAERNGYNITARPLIAIQNVWSSVKQKSIETFSKESNSTDWVSKEKFMDEIQRVLYSGNSSEHAAVNDAAAMYREVIDNTWRNYRKAYNLPEDWMPPKTAEGYLMRVYDTVFMNDNEEKWNEVITGWLRESDNLILERMNPIHELDAQIKDFEAAHTEAVKELGKRESSLNPGTELVPYSQEVGLGIKTYQVKGREQLTSSQKELPGHVENTIDNEHVITLAKMRQQLKYMKENLQNELRSNPELNIHVDDVHALSSNESKELKNLLKPINNIKKKIDEQKSIVNDLKSKRSRQLSAAKNTRTIEKAKPKAKKYVITDEEVSKAEDDLHKLNLSMQDEEYRLYDLARNGQVNPRLYYPETFKFKDPNDRLKFRDVYQSDFDREHASKAYYNSIMNMHPEDVVSDVFGKVMGNAQANPLKQRTLLIPDELLYNNNFMSKDLFAKTANYINYLDRRTHLKTSFQHVTINGNFEELAEGLQQRYENRRSTITQRLNKLNEMIEGKEGKELKSIQKEIKSEKKKFREESVNFDNIKKTMKTLFETRMMGIKKRDDFTNGFMRSIMALTAATNLHNLPATQITDIAWGGFQHGIWPYIRDGIYPIMESMAGILKTKDSEALREMAPHINLGYQDVGNNYADKNWHSELQPNINMGKIVSGIEKFSHFVALTDLSPYIDNGIQRAHGSVIQSRFMELLHKQIEGNLKPKDKLYLIKYGIDPEKWADRMVKTYKESEGFRTKLGGYMSKSWQWQDLEAANVFNDAVYKGIQNTLVWKGMADSPFFADNILGIFLHTFTGWTYAATNRYLIPSLQHADGELLIKIMWMMGAGAIVSPMRRIARGEDPEPENMTPEQRSYEVWQDSGVTSAFGNVLAIANLMSSDNLLGNLKNDKFKHRLRSGIFGMPDIVSSTASRISDVLGMVNSGLDEKDLKTAAHMLPITGAMYGRYFSDKLIESWDLPRNKRAAEFQN